MLFFVEGPLMFAAQVPVELPRLQRLVRVPLEDPAEHRGVRRGEHELGQDLVWEIYYSISYCSIQKSF